MVSDPEKVTSELGFRYVMIEQLEPHPDNPRKTFDDESLTELAESIEKNGVLLPLLAMPAPDAEGRFRIICGERRWRAAKRAGLGTVPCIVREMDRRQQLEAMLIENLQRADVDPVEEARGFGLLLNEAGLTQTELGDQIGKSQAYVANRMRLLDLPDEALDIISREMIPPKTALALVKASRWPEICVEAAKRLASEDVTSRKAPEVVARVITEHARPLTGHVWTGKEHVHPAFDPSMFEGHPDLVKIDGRAYLVNIPEWERAHKDALDLRARETLERLKSLPDAPAEVHSAVAKAEKNPTPGKAHAELKKVIPELSSLDYNAYTRLDVYGAEGADCEACECRRYALGSDGKPVPICIKPGNFKARLAKTKREENKVARDALAEEYERISEAAAPWVDKLVGVDHPLLVYLAKIILTKTSPEYYATDKRRISPKEYAKKLWGDDAPDLIQGHNIGLHDFLLRQPSARLARVVVELPALAEGANLVRTAGIILGNVTPFSHIDRMYMERAGRSPDIEVIDDPEARDTAMAEWRQRVRQALELEGVQIPEETVEAWTLVELTQAETWAQAMSEHDPGAEEWSTADPSPPAPPEHLWSFVRCDDCGAAIAEHDGDVCPSVCSECGRVSGSVSSEDPIWPEDDCCPDCAGKQDAGAEFEGLIDTDEEIAQREDVRALLDLGLSDDGWEDGLRALNDVELQYCLRHETRKGALKRLQAEAALRGLDTKEAVA